MSTQASDARLSEKERKDKQLQEEKKAAQRALFRKDLDETFGTQAGRRVLRYLMDACGYQRPSIIAEPASGNPLTEGTIYNEARRNLYLSLRREIRREILMEVECGSLEDEMFQ